MIGKLKILQCNLNRSIQATENALQLAVELNIDILAVQEPWLPKVRGNTTYKDIQSISQNSFIPIFPTIEVDYPISRAMYYVSRCKESMVSQWKNCPKDSDILGVNLKHHGQISTLFNIYNQ